MSNDTILNGEETSDLLDSVLGTVAGDIEDLPDLFFNLPTGLLILQPNSYEMEVYEYTRNRGKSNEETVPAIRIQLRHSVVKKLEIEESEAFQGDLPENAIYSESFLLDIQDPNATNRKMFKKALVSYLKATPEEVADLSLREMLEGFAACAEDDTGETCYLVQVTNRASRNNPDNYNTRLHVVPTAKEEILKTLEE